MNLPVPTVGIDPGPDWATNLNAALSIMDQHDHSSGSGVPVVPAGININSSLQFNNNLAVSLAGVTLLGQASSPAINTIFNSNNSSGDLYYTNNAGLDIQITNAAGIVGSPGTISGISGTASASYSTPTFFWRSATAIAANMDFGSAIFRNLSPNSTNGVTLSAPSALGSNYDLALPLIPAVISFMTLDVTGDMGVIDLNGALTSSNLSASAGILGSQLSATAGITGAQIAASTISSSNLAAGAAVGNIAVGAIAGNQISSSAALQVFTVQASGQLQVGGHNAISSNTNPPAGTNSLCMVRGTVVGGSLVGGEGFSCSGAGSTVNITWSVAFADAPAVVATSLTPGNIAAAYSATTAGVVIDEAGENFHFMAIGRRA